MDRRQEDFQQEDQLRGCCITVQVNESWNRAGSWLTKAQMEGVLGIELTTCGNLLRLWQLSS